MVTRQLHKSSLKVLGYRFFSGRSCLETLVENDFRRYPLDAEINLVIYTNQGNLNVVTVSNQVIDTAANNTKTKQCNFHLSFPPRSK